MPRNVSSPRCVASYRKLSCLHQQEPGTVLSPSVRAAQGPGSGLAERFWLRASPLRPAPSGAWTNHAGCWREASAPCRTDLPAGLLGRPHHAAAGFPPGNGPRENKLEAAQSCRAHPGQSQAHIPAGPTGYTGQPSCSRGGVGHGPGATLEAGCRQGLYV